MRVPNLEGIGDNPKLTKLLRAIYLQPTSQQTMYQLRFVIELLVAAQAYLQLVPTNLHAGRKVSSIDELEKLLQKIIDSLMSIHKEIWAAEYKYRNHFGFEYMEVEPALSPEATIEALINAHGCIWYSAEMLHGNISDDYTNEPSFNMSNVFKPELDPDVDRLYTKQQILPNMERCFDELFRHLLILNEKYPLLDLESKLTIGKSRS